MSVGAKRYLHQLIKEFRDGKIECTIFCSEFERIYNFDVNKESFSEVEATAFGDLFEKVVWYSPYPKERAEIPHDLGENEIRRAANVAERSLHRRHS